MITIFGLELSNILISVAVAVLSYLFPLIRAKIKATNFEHFLSITMMVVKAIEQLYEKHEAENKGQLKLETAINDIQTECKKRGIKVDNEVIIKAVESCLFNLKLEKEAASAIIKSRVI